MKSQKLPVKTPDFKRSFEKTARNQQILLLWNKHYTYFSRSLTNCYRKLLFSAFQFDQT